MSFVEIIEKYPNWANYITISKSGKLWFQKYKHIFVIDEQYDYSNIYETYDYIRGFLLANNFYETSMYFIYNIDDNIIGITCYSGVYYIMCGYTKYDSGDSEKLIEIIKKKLNINDSVNKLVEL